MNLTAHQDVAGVVERPEICLNYRYRLLPTKKQHAALQGILHDQRMLYNAALEERIDCHRKTGKRRTFVDQCRALTEWRQQDREAASTPANLQRWTLRRIDDAYNSFFRRVRTGVSKVGYPRFKGIGRWRTFGFAEFSGIRLNGSRISFNGLPGSIRIHMHRKPPAGRPIGCSFTKDAKGWSISLQFRVPVEATRATNRLIGIDMGLSTFAALSDGTLIESINVAKLLEPEKRRLNRAVARCKRQSSGRARARRRLANLHLKIANSRGTRLHQISAKIVENFDFIAVEKLNVKGMSRGILAKPIHEAAWTKFREMLIYKAAKAGCELIEVDSRLTSQTCPVCHAIKPKTLSERTHSCPCGCEMDRDVAAAKIILNRAVVRPRTANVAP